MRPRFKIDGSKVLLRTTHLSDLSSYKRWNNAGLKAWDYDSPWLEHDLQAIIEWRKRWLYDSERTPLRFLEIENETGNHVGWVVVYYDENDPHMTEIGIDIPDEIFWNRGYGFEALTLWIDYLFEAFNLERVGMTTWSGNPRMISLAQKLGFQVEGKIRNGCCVKGKYYDRIKMGILKSEWNPQKKA